MAITRVYYRADFDGSLSQEDRLNFIDQHFDDCCGKGIDGLIIGRGNGTEWILEGDPTKVDAKVSELESASQLQNNETISKDTVGSSSGAMVSHVDGDARDSS